LQLIPIGIVVFIMYVGRCLLCFESLFDCFATYNNNIGTDRCAVSCVKLLSVGGMLAVAIHAGIMDDLLAYQTDLAE
jgi:hypothetical protein